MRGIYALVIEVKKRGGIQIGKLGKFTFAEGFYVYMGSAKGGLEKRVRRHLGTEKKLFWHIDYLLDAPRVKINEVWARRGGGECSVADRMIYNGTFQIPVPGFGSSDCKCRTHLFLILQPGKEARFFRQNNFFCLTRTQNLINFKKGSLMAKIKINVERCKGCGFCAHFCPRGLIYLNSDFNQKGYHPAIFKQKEKDSCNGCGICALVCPDTAITVYKEREKGR